MSEILEFLFRPDAATGVFYGTVITLAAVVMVGLSAPRDGGHDQLGLLISSGEPVLVLSPTEVYGRPAGERAFDLQVAPQLLREGHASDG